MKRVDRASPARPVSTKENDVRILFMAGPSSGHSFARDLTRGFVARLAEHPHWHARIFDLWSMPPEVWKDMIRNARAWRPHAVILREARVMPSIYNTVVDLAPIRVGLFFDHPKLDASLRIDNAQVGRCAAEYLLDLGWRRFALVNLRGSRWGEQRLKGFADQVLANGGEIVARFDVETTGGEASALWGEAPVALVESMRAIPLPCALFAANDSLAFLAAAAARAAGIELPYQMAILGADNDSLRCEISQPPLSSVLIPFEHMGAAAADAIDEILRQAPDRQRDRVFGAAQIVERASTQAYPTEDERLRRATDFIRRKFREDVAVPDIARAAGVSRRTLEMLFHEHFGRGPHQIVREFRVREACLLLTQTNWKCEFIAETLRISNYHFASVLREAVGCSPSEYRARAAKGAPPAIPPHPFSQAARMAAQRALRSTPPTRPGRRRNPRR